MNFDLSDDQSLFKATVERFTGAGDVETRKRAQRQPGGVDPKRWAELAELGLLALPASEKAGGLGGTLLDCAVVAEALGRGAAPDPWLEAAFLPLRLLGDAEAAGAVARGEARVAFAFAEPGQRYRLDPVVTRASVGRVNGAKSFVLAGEAADSYLVTALAEDGPALFAVAREHVEARAYTVVDGGRAVELTLRNAPATPIADWPHVVAAIDEARLIASAEMLGLAHRLFDETLAYVRQREQFGQSLGRFQALQHRLVDCYAMLDLMRSALWRGLLGGSASGTKAFVAERALHIGHEAIQMHGGMGVTDELIVGHAHKRVMLLAKLFGDPAADLATYAEAA